MENRCLHLIRPEQRQFKLQLNFKMLHKTKEIKILQPFRVEFFFPAAAFYRSLGTTGLVRSSEPELHELVFNSQALDPLSVFAKIYNKNYEIILGFM